VVNAERYKKGYHFDDEYFENLLQQIREIRLSERRIYLKLTDIFALSSDYSRNSKVARLFFAFIQNKLHYAIAGGTAAEIIYNRADHEKDHMGLTTWNAAPDGKIIKSDVTVAKNYLSKDELESLSRMVSAFLDLAEDRARRHLPTTMTDWIKYMSNFLDMNDYPELQGAGSISKAEADEKAIAEYEDFRIRQDAEFLGEFERYLEDTTSRDEGDNA
jgi:hypothetical protein